MLVYYNGCGMRFIYMCSPCIKKQRILGCKSSKRSLHAVMLRDSSVAILNG